MPYICHKWDQTAIKWNVANWKWSECQFVLDLFSAGSTGVPGEMALPAWLHEEVPYDAYAELKKKKFIEILCKVKGEPLYEAKVEKMMNKKISASDIKMVIKEVTGIDVSILER